MADVATLLSDPSSVGVWTLVPAESSIGFSTKTMWGLVPVKGKFTEFSGDGQITDAQTVFGRIDIKAASLATGIGKRDKDLRAPEFFDVEKYPEINIVVTSAEAIQGDAIDLRANLTVKTTTAPLPLKTKVTVLGDGSVRVTTQTSVSRKELGVQGNMIGMIGDKTTLSADLLFRRAAG
jgi:polyisoprenoid-binding protein YceI